MSDTAPLVGDIYRFEGLPDKRFVLTDADIADPRRLSIHSISLTGKLCLRDEENVDIDGDAWLIALPLTDFLVLRELGIYVKEEPSDDGS